MWQTNTLKFPPLHPLAAVVVVVPRTAAVALVLQTTTKMHLRKLTIFSCNGQASWPHEEKQRRLFTIKILHGCMQHWTQSLMPWFFLVKEEVVIVAVTVAAGDLFLLTKRDLWHDFWIEKQMTWDQPFIKETITWRSLGHGFQTDTLEDGKLHYKMSLVVVLVSLLLVQVVLFLLQTLGAKKRTWLWAKPTTSRNWCWLSWFIALKVSCRQRPF